MSSKSSQQQSNSQAVKPSDVSSATLVTEDVCTKSTSDIVCLLCEKHVGSDKCLFSCDSCHGVTHISCILKQYKDKCGTQLRNSFEWMYEFLCYGNFRYFCFKCVASSQTSMSSQQSSLGAQKLHTGNESLINDMKIIQQQVCTIGQRLDTLQNELFSRLDSLIITSPAIDPISAADNSGGETATAGLSSTQLPQTVTKGLLFSTVAGKGLSEVVKSAVAETIAKHKDDDAAKFAVAIYGLPENKSDLKDIYNVLRIAGSKATVRYHRRVGRKVANPDAANVKLRPLRVELTSVQDREQLLTLSRNLKQNKNTAKVIISPWLLLNEITRIRKLRMRYNDLNSNIPDKKEQYVIRSGRLAKLTKDGKFQYVTYPDSLAQSSSNKTQNSPQSKNASGGSQVAP